MLKQILIFLSENWAQWLTLSFFSIFGIAYRKLLLAVNAEKAKNKAMAQGVEALLRDRIIENYNKYEKTGSCPIYAKENVKRMYAPYHKLGGNDVATELVEKLLEMPSN